MTIDLTALNAANDALQKDSKAAKTVKVYGAEATKIFNQMQAGGAPVPQPPSGYPFVPQPPNVAGAVLTSAQWYRDTANPITIKQIQVKTADGYGLALMGYFSASGRPAPSPSAFTVADIIGESTQAFDDAGRSGAGVWIGTQANVARVKGTANNMGIWTGCNCLGSTFTDFGAYGTHVGMYVEHVTSKTTFKNFDIKGDSQNSVNIEWWYGGEGSSELTFDTGSIYCPPGAHGIFADAGTWGCVFKNIDFYGPGDAIATPNNLAGPTDNVVTNCRFHNSGSQWTRHSNAIG